MFIVFTGFSCLALLSCTELCIFLFRLALFVSTLAKRLSEKTILSWYLLCRRVCPTKTRL